MIIFLMNVDQFANRSIKIVNDDEQKKNEIQQKTQTLAETVIKSFRAIKKRAKTKQKLFALYS